MVAKKYRIRYRKDLVSEKVSDSVSKIFGIGKSFGYGFVQILVILGDVSVLKLLGFETFTFFRWFWFQYRKNLVSKKYRIRYQKKLASIKVSDSVSEKIGIEKSFGFGFVQILVIVTH